MIARASHCLASAFLDTSAIDDDRAGGRRGRSFLCAGTAETAQLLEILVAPSVLRT